jgi:hypothetical protein
MGRLRTGVGVDKIKGAEPSQFSPNERHEIKAGLTGRLDEDPQKIIQMAVTRKSHEDIRERQKPGRFPEYCIIHVSAPSVHLHRTRAQPAAEIIELNIRMVRQQ